MPSVSTHVSKVSSKPDLRGQVHVDNKRKSLECLASALSCAFNTIPGNWQLILTIPVRPQRPK